MAGQKIFGFMWTNSLRLMYIFDYIRYVGPWSSYLPSLSFIFFIGKVRIILSISYGRLLSAWHVGEKIEDIPKEVLMDCAHLVKANSIQGCKMNNVNVVYTPWSNLKKTADMDVGQIGFHRQKDVSIVTVEKKVNEILNRLEKTKMERFPDLAAEKECRDREERNEKKAQIQEMKKREKEEMKKKREMDELRSYSSLMKVENMSSNQDGNDSDEFM
ncbi:coiled-coil domain-containing protein 25 isoform X2 [Rhinolophus sinicus]|uniref:coiled-coil domain-containing protein 25 isoform X2 n=1 Tax=Rhinolophus sinicus TaxID=89399 RepID=UPI003D7BE87D